MSHTYTQSGRLKEHIASKHADQAEPAPPPPSTGTAQAIMDVGSRAGAYDRKSPKLLLQEHCLKLKQLKPRYTLTDGGQTCKVKLLYCGLVGQTTPDNTPQPPQVVLPAPKPTDPPTVLRYTAPNGVQEPEDMVAQRGALVALHHVAGQRQFDLVLPDMFLQQWRLLGEQVLVAFSYLVLEWGSSPVPIDNFFLSLGCSSVGCAAAAGRSRCRR